MKIEQLNVGRILVKPMIAGAEEKTAGGIVIPEMYRTVEGGVKTAVVVSVGPPRYDQAGKPTAIEFKVGDTVLLDNLGLIKVKVGGEEMFLLRQEDIIGKL